MDLFSFLDVFTPDLTDIKPSGAKFKKGDRVHDEFGNAGTIIGLAADGNGDTRYTVEFDNTKQKALDEAALTKGEPQPSQLSSQPKDSESDPQQPPKQAGDMQRLLNRVVKPQQADQSDDGSTGVDVGGNDFQSADSEIDSDDSDNSTDGDSDDTALCPQHGTPVDALMCGKCLFARELDMENEEVDCSFNDVIDQQDDGIDDEFNNDKNAPDLGDKMVEMGDHDDSKIQWPAFLD